MAITPFNRSYTVPTLYRKDANWVRVGPSGAATGVYTETRGVMTASDVKNGFRDTEWKTKVLSRSNASLAYTARRTKIQPSMRTIYCDQWYDYYPGYYTYRKIVSSLRFNPDVSAYLQEGLNTYVDQIALKRLKSEIQRQTGQINALVPLVELREMRSLIQAAAFSALDLTKALIDIKRTKGRSAAQFASHAWLNWSFGIAPTLSEITQIGQSIDKFLRPGNEPMYYASGSASQVKNIPNLEFYAAPDGQQGWNTVGSSLRLRQSVRYKTGFRIPVKSANLYGAMDQFGFEIGSLAPAAWELTAFSWLFDYFTTMGEFLDDTFTGDGVLPVYCDRTFKSSHIFVLDPGRPPPSMFGSANGKYLKWSITGTPTIVESEYISRTPFGTTIPSRALRFRTVDEIGKNSINKLLNLGSILVGGKAFSNKVRF